MIEVVMCGGRQRTVALDAPLSQCIHSEHVLGLHIARAGRYQLGEEVHDIRGPFIGVLPAGDLDCNGLTGDIDSSWCLFRSDLITGDGHRVTFHWGETAVCRSHLRWLGTAEVRHARSLHGQLQQLHARPSAHERIQAGALVLELLALWASPGAAGAAADPVTVYRDRIEERADDPTCSLEELGRDLGLHEDWLRRRFVTAYGMTPVEYRIRLRLQRARDLLQTTALPIAEVGRRVGFASASHFSRLFRRQFDCSPSDLTRLGG